MLTFMGLSMLGATRAILLEHMRTCDKRQAITEHTLQEIKNEQLLASERQQKRHEENLKSISGLKVGALWAALTMAGTVLAFILSQVVHFSVSVGH